MFLSGEKVEGERCMSADGSSVKGSSQQSFTFGPKVKGGAHYFQVRAHLLLGGAGKRYYTCMTWQRYCMGKIDNMKYNKALI